MSYFGTAPDCGVRSRFSKRALRLPSGQEPDSASVSASQGRSRTAPVEEARTPPATAGQAATVVAAPSLHASEVANALWKYVKAGNLDAETALERLEESINLIDAFTPDWELTTEALTEAVRFKHPVYDLLYAVLARRTGCPVLTMDERLRTLLGQMGGGIVSV